ncbi:MAG: tetratricopeptide repeat protein [Chitinophagales bacterium]|nr:tetratricopeptide repeat protein [Chitinophagales bacterium]
MNSFSAEELRRFLEEGRLEEALAWLESIQPADARVWHERSRILCKLDRVEEALQAANMAVELAPDNATYLLERGTILLRMKKLAVALLDMNRAVELDPFNPFPLACRAHLKDLAGDTEGAIADYEKALTLDPDDALLMNGLELMQEKLAWNRGDPEDSAAFPFLIPFQQDKEVSAFSPLDREDPGPRLRFELTLRMLRNPEMRRQFLRFVANFFRRAQDENEDA